MGRGAIFWVSRNAYSDRYDDLEGPAQQLPDPPHASNHPIFATARHICSLNIITCDESAKITTLSAGQCSSAG